MDPPPLVDLNATRVALTALHHNGFAGAEWAAERLARLQADLELVERLREDGVDGEEYVVFEATLASYGYPVLLAWIRRREIYRLTYELGRPVKCSGRAEGTPVLRRRRPAGAGDGGRPPCPGALP